MPKARAPAPIADPTYQKLLALRCLALLPGNNNIVVQTPLHCNILAHMEPSSRHEEHIGRDAIGGIPSISNTNVSGGKHTCQSCGITASGSKPTPSSSSKPASGPSSTSSSSSKTASGHEPAPSANLSASGPEPASAVDGPETAIGGSENVRQIHCRFNTASFTPSSVNVARSTPNGANIASFTPSLSGPEPSHLSRPEFADLRGNVTEFKQEDDDAWFQRIDLRAVECCEEGIELSTPPFPFHKRWDLQYRKKRRNRMPLARATDADYEKWSADGKPLCSNCGKRHAPPCSAPSRRKRRAEEPAEGSMARASRRRIAIPRGHRASAQAVPSAMDSPPAHRFAPVPNDTRTMWELMSGTPQLLAQMEAEISRRLDAASTTRERADAFYSMFNPVSPPIPAVTAPASDQPVAQGWPTRSDWATESTWTSETTWVTQDDWPNLGAQSTNPRPRGQAGRRQPRANRATRNRRN
jgi:hypothetical protein